MADAGGADAPRLDAARPDAPGTIDAPSPSDDTPILDTPTAMADAPSLDAPSTTDDVPVAIDAPVLFDTPVVMIDAPVVDAPPMTPDAPRPDAPRVDAPLPMCGMVGQVGGHCRTNMCTGVLRCQTEVLAMGGAVFTVRAGFGIEQGEPDPSAPGFYLEDLTPAATSDVPLPMATGSLCTQDCDAAAAVDPCGTCATCAQDIGTVGVLTTDLLYAAGTAPFAETGWCRADCAFDPAVSGAECPTGHTCSPSSRVCVESCVSSNECRFTFEETREGLFVTVIDATGATCGASGRCEWTHAGTESVGDLCDRNSDCTEDVGVCLRGGTCGEYDCATAVDTTIDSVCDGGRGICLGNGGHGASICVDGCSVEDDCNPGSTCIPLGGGMTAGPFRGYCLGICDEVRNDPDGTGPLIAADDVLWACRTGEACDQAAPTAGNLDPTGTCRPPCTVDGDCTGPAERCDTTLGFCRVPDQVCDAVDLTADCFLGQVCDLLAFPENLGLCVEPCTGDPDCAVGDRCLTTGGRRVCRTPCAAGCTTGEVCQAGYCEQMTVP